MLKSSRPNQEENDMVFVFITFGLVSFFNGISTFMGYLMSKPSL